MSTPTTTHANWPDDGGRAVRRQQHGPASEPGRGWPQVLVVGAGVVGRAGGTCWRRDKTGRALLLLRAQKTMGGKDGG